MVVRLSAVMSMIVGLLVAAVAAGPQAQATTWFRDVPPQHSFFNQINWLAASGITSGYGDGTFRPSTRVTRAQMASFLYRRAGRPSVTLPSRSPYPDVATSNGHYRAIVWMERQDITSGYPDGTFRPQATVTRGQMAAFLYRAAGRPAYTPPARSPYPDVSTSHSFYKQIAWMRARNITSGYADGRFGPSGSVTRGQMAAFLYRFGGASGMGVPSTWNQARNRAHTQINAQRTGNLRDFQRHTCLDRFAQWHAQRLASRSWAPQGGSAQGLRHSTFAEFQRACPSFTKFSENIGWNNHTAPVTSANQIVQGWMNSPGHRANILQRSTSQPCYHGIGAARGGDRWWYSSVLVCL